MSEPASINMPSPRPHWHGFYTVEDPHGRWWRNLRAHYWIGLGPELDREGNVPWTFHVGGEWVHLHGTLRRLRLKVSTTGEDTLDVAYGLGPLAQHYWTLEVDRTEKDYTGSRPGQLYRWRRRQLRLPPVRFDVEVGLTGAAWCFGSDDGSWHRDASRRERLRRNRVTWWRYAAGYRRGEPETVADAWTSVWLPEGAYPLHVRLQREVRQPRLGPLWMLSGSRHWRGPTFWLPWGRHVCWVAEWDSPEGLPVPGKGESSYDCGQDRIFASGVNVGPPDDAHDRQWVAAAVTSATSSVLRTRTRTRHGAGVADTGA